MRTTAMALFSALALAPLVGATPAAAQDATHALPNYRPGDLGQGLAGVLAAPFEIAFTPWVAAFAGGWPVSNCQRTQAWTGREWRIVTVCN